MEEIKEAIDRNRVQSGNYKLNLPLNLEPGYYYMTHESLLHLLSLVAEKQRNKDVVYYEAVCNQFNEDPITDIRLVPLITDTLKEK